MSTGAFVARRNGKVFITGNSGFPKSLDVSKAIDKAAPRTGMFEAFAKYYAEQRKAKGLTHSAICEAGKFYENQNHGGASVNWEKGYNVPTSSQWKVLQPLLNLSLEWLPLIERIEAEREVVAKQRGNLLAVAPGQDNDRSATTLDVTAPATEAARQWQGWGTALKPALEPITVARKPLGEGTVAANVLEHGTGALNIDGCRVPTNGEVTGGSGGRTVNLPENVGAAIVVGRSGGNGGNVTPDAGRWPANLIHDGSDEVLAGFPQTGPSKAAPRGSVQRYDPADTDAKRPKGGNEVRGIDDAGGSAARFFKQVGPEPEDLEAARFMYCAKASKRDRDEGLDAFEEQQAGVKNDSGRGFSEVDPYAKVMRKNVHPTVKPTDLMAYLVRLVTPPGGIVLDPFMGSGSTGKAAMREGMRFIGCELSDEYLAIARARIEHEAARIQAERQAAEKAATPSPQFDLFAS